MRNSLRDILLRNVLPPVLALATSLILCAGFVAAIGLNPVLVYERLLTGTLGNEYGLGQVIFKATTLMFSALAVSFAFKAGMFNVGGEGQIAMGAFATAVSGYLLASLPSILLIPVSILSGIAGGAALGCIPGYLRSKFGSHEVINTIMLNFIVAAFISYCVNNLLLVPATIHTPPVGEGAILPTLGESFSILKGSPANVSIFIALVSLYLVYHIGWKTRWGYELRSIGLNIHAATYAGMPVQKHIILAMTASGGLAGLVGANTILGYKHYYEIGFTDGLGFLGIAVALLGNNHPLGILAAALLFGMLDYGGIVINPIVPKEVITILQGMIIILILIFGQIFRSKRIAGLFGIQSSSYV